MATLVVGAMTRKQTEADIQSEAEYARALMGSKQFQLLLTDTADRLAMEWSVAPNTAEREAAFYKLDGLRSLIRELQTKSDQALAAAKR